MIDEQLTIPSIENAARFQYRFETEPATVDVETYARGLASCSNFTEAYGYLQSLVCTNLCRWGDRISEKDMQRLFEIVWAKRE